MRHVWIRRERCASFMDEALFGVHHLWIGRHLVCIICESGGIRCASCMDWIGRHPFASFVDRVASHVLHVGIGRRQVCII